MGTRFGNGPVSDMIDVLPDVWDLRNDADLSARVLYYTCYIQSRRCDADRSAVAIKPAEEHDSRVFTRHRANP